MEIARFLQLLLHALSQLEFVQKIDISTEVFVLRGRAVLRNDLLLHVYYNEVTGTTAFALIAAEKRIWGIDYDKSRGWHEHRLDNPEGHSSCAEKSVEEIVRTLAEVWLCLRSSD